jgi:hypothetical protein
VVVFVQTFVNVTTGLAVVAAPLLILREETTGPA